MEPVLSAPRFDPQTASRAELSMLVQRLLDEEQRSAAALVFKEAEIRRQTAELHAKDLKIQLLTLELAHLRRIRFGVKSEALPVAQRDVFEDSWNEDLSAVTAEVEHLAEPPSATVARPKRPRASPCRRICRASTIATNPIPASAATAGRR